MRQWTHLEPRDWAFCSVFGAAALLLPLIFHVLQLGKIFLPMYLPLFALAFVVRPYPCALTAALVPLLSAVLTGMPPLYPPVAWIMSVELALSTSAVAWAAGRFPNRSPVLYLLPVLVLGRALNAGLNYFVATWMSLPGSFLAGASFLSGWPGIVLLLLTIPAFTRLFSAYRPPPARGTKGVAAR
jgi:hypothetical protein